jgi:hypothetical protein
LPIVAYIAHTESWLDLSQSLSAAATPSRRRRSSDEEEEGNDDSSFSFMNETIVDEELIGTQFSLEQEQEEEEEKDEVHRVQCCESGMFIPDPNISIPDPGSKRDPGSGSASKNFSIFNPEK